ncbi:DUF397 domain-containing protein [Streptomyces zingiberis]|uniref:DUF397 domain-containing protein n=1 Tax=Streptomyces zingiberis TaxID=2053010 RepID=A0ABX1BUU8_9ACTN|nr:DUF397 domain-containing protein [Streptomyces zingiberis]NJP99526.1 DUF397 domain-containing protein [Streptomyces zingiberis]
MAKQTIRQNGRNVRQRQPAHRGRPVRQARNPAGPWRWQKSSYSQEEGECVELATAGSAVALRESDTPGTVLTVSAAALGALLRGVKAGEFDGPGGARRGG